MEVGELIAAAAEFVFGAPVTAPGTTVIQIKAKVNVTAAGASKAAVAAVEKAGGSVTLAAVGAGVARDESEPAAKPES